jgi:hypothetical protein
MSKCVHLMFEGTSQLASERPPVGRVDVGRSRGRSSIASLDSCNLVPLASQEALIASSRIGVYRRAADALPFGDDKVFPW